MAKRNEKCSLFLLVALAAVIVLLAAQVKPAVAAGYIPEIENAVNAVVKSKRDVAPGLIRLLFHDCFVRGCDGSVLLLKTPKTVFPKTEQGSDFNRGLRGLELIEQIRVAIFNAIKVNVSCADTVVFAAREATSVLSNGDIKYDIDGPGRDDGVISSADDPGTFLPAPTFTFAQLRDNFKAKGFNVTELVALSATHGIGVCHRPSFEDRLNPSIALPLVNEQIDVKYQGVIRNESQPPNDKGVFLNNIRDMPLLAVETSGYTNTEAKLAAVGVFDNSYYDAVLQNMNRFKSDWELRQDPTGFATKLLDEYKAKPDVWKAAFRAAMTRLSNDLTLKSKGPFEAGIRKDCTRTNLDSYS